MKRITISVINDLVTDQRVQRMIGTLEKQDAEIFLIGRKLRNSLPMPVVGYRVRRMNMVFTHGPLFYAFYNVRILFILLFSRRQDLFISNDLDTLPANYLAGRIRRTPVLYDSHEYFTEVPELVDRPGTRKIWEKIERKILPDITYAMTVSNSIAEEYEKKYGTKFSVVRNVSESKIVEKDPSFSDRYAARYKIIYQGALNVGRGLEMVITAMQWIPDTILLIAGDGDIRIELQRLVHDLKITDKVIFPGKIPPGMLHKITSQCDLGISLEEDMGLNYRFALPNKLFDYVQARIPVLCSDLPEMRELIEHFEIGEVLLERDSQKLAQQILEIFQNEKRTADWRRNLDFAAGELCWENEENKLKVILEGIWGIKV